MIIEFSVKNFLSFKDKVTFSMTANNITGLDDNYITINDKKILKTSALYGANASGKSNLFKILSIVADMLNKSSIYDINYKLPIVPFKFDKESLNNPSEFEIRLLINNIRYVYGFKANQKEIIEEYLYYYPNGRETKVFDRVNVNSYSFNQKDERILKDIATKNTNNKFFLATATNWNFSKTKDVYDFLTSKIKICFNIEDLKKKAFNIYAHENPKLKEFTLDFLKKTDFNIEDYKIVEFDSESEYPFLIMENSKSYQVLFKHKGSSEYLSFDEESLGTKMVFSLIPFINNTINQKGVLVIDELDKSLHPYLVNYIVSMFNDKEINKGAQLIFNTHDTNLLNLNVLRRAQIWFTEKNDKNGECDLYSLSDYSVRKSENIEKGYMLGKYGGVPFIKNDWNLWEE